MGQTRRGGRRGWAEPWERRTWAEWVRHSTGIQGTLLHFPCDRSPADTSAYTQVPDRSWIRYLENWQLNLPLHGLALLAQHLLSLCPWSGCKTLPSRFGECRLWMQAGLGKGKPDWWLIRIRAACHEPNAAAHITWVSSRLQACTMKKIFYY